MPKKTRFQHAFVTSFNNEHPRMKNILLKHWHILKSNPHLKTVYPKNQWQFIEGKNVKKCPDPSDITKLGKKRPAIHTAEQYGKDKCKCCNSITDRTVTILKNLS